MSDRVPRFLSGSVFFFLLSVATPKRPTPKEKEEGNKDSHKDPELMKDLMYVLRGSYSAITGKDVSKYLGGEIEFSAGLPFNDDSVVSSFCRSMVEDYQSVLNRMFTYTEKHIDPQKQDWLIRALLETIDFDDAIQPGHHFILGDNMQLITKTDLLKESNYTLEHMLLGLFHFIVKHRYGKNSLGNDTLLELGYKRGVKTRTAAPGVGDSVTRTLNVTRINQPKTIDSHDIITTDIAPAIPVSNDQLVTLPNTGPSAGKNVYVEKVENLHLEISPKLAEEKFFGEYSHDYQIVESLLKELQARRPKKLRKPPEIDHSIEDPFFLELLDVYSEQEGKVFLSRSELSEQWQEDLEFRRDDFYAAETVHAEAINTLGEHGKAEFQFMKDEVLSIVNRTYVTARNLDGFSRMEKVMARAEDVPCEKTIFGRSGWVGAEERRGVCHMLAGDHTLRWVNHHE